MWHIVFIDVKIPTCCFFYLGVQAIPESPKCFIHHRKWKCNAWKKTTAHPTVGKIMFLGEKWGMSRNGLVIWIRIRIDSMHTEQSPPVCYGLRLMLYDFNSFRRCYFSYEVSYGYNTQGTLYELRTCNGQTLSLAALLSFKYDTCGIVCIDTDTRTDMT